MRHFYLTLFALLACDSRHSVSNEIYIGIYGRPKDKIEVKIDNEIIYEKDTTMTRLLEIQRGPINVNKTKVVFSYRIDDKDTVFTYELKRRNYFNIGYSDIHKEFQFHVDDSIHFFNSRID